MDGQSPSVGDFKVEDAIKTYQQLITQLPPLNRQLLLYILDLLAVFASKADLNKMTTANLAAIFQPGILSHPAHDMAPPEYRLSQDVLIFLIENQDNFLIGMQGTAADEKTVAEVESGPPTPHNRSSTRNSKSNIGRSGSNSSKYSGVRRSVSASSRRSRNSAAAAPSPSGSDFHVPHASSPVSAGVHRSNTLPTRSPNLTPGRFGRDKDSGQKTPDLIVEVDEKKATATQKPKPERKFHSQAIMQEILSPADDDIPSLPSSAPLGGEPKPQDQATRNQGINRQTPGYLVLPPNPLNPPSDQLTPTGSRIVTALFGAKSPPSDGKRPNKLQKRRTGGSANPSAHSSTQSLNEPSDIDPSHPSIQNSLLPNAPLLTPRKENIAGQMWQDNTSLKTPPTIGGNFKPYYSPAASYASQSDLDGADPEHLNLQGDENTGDGNRRRHWFSRDRKQDLSPQQASTALGSNGLAQTSRNSVLSGGEGGGRKSFTMDRSQQGGEGVMSDSERESRKEKNPINWIKGKVRDFQDKIDERDRIKEERRMASPTRVPDERSGSTEVPTSIDSLATKPSLEQQKNADLLMPRSQIPTALIAPQRQSQDIQRSTPQNNIVPSQAPSSVASAKPSATTVSDKA
jgi:hypothetical protein